MPKVKALHSIGVAHLLGEHVIPNADGIIPNGAKLELSEDLINIIGPDSFEIVASEEAKMSDEVNTTEQTPVQPETVTPETPVQPEAPVENTPEVAPTTPETTVTPASEQTPAA